MEIGRLIPMYMYAGNRRLFPVQCTWHLRGIQSEAEGYPQREFFTHNALVFLISNNAKEIFNIWIIFSAYKTSIKTFDYVSRLIHCLILKRIVIPKKNEIILVH